MSNMQKTTSCDFVTKLFQNQENIYVAVLWIRMNDAIITITMRAEKTVRTLFSTDCVGSLCKQIKHSRTRRYVSGSPISS